MQSFICSINKQVITTLKTGKGEKLIIVLPGYSLSAEWSLNHFTGLLKYGTSYSINFPGFHGSDLIKDHLDSELIYQCICQIMSVQESKKISLVGHSFGGRNAMLIAEKHPEIIEELTLIAPVVQINKLENWLKWLPENLLNHFIKFLFINNNLLKLAGFFHSLKLIANVDHQYIQKQFKNEENVRLLKYYGLSLPYLYISSNRIKKLFSILPTVNLYLSKDDPYCDYNYWHNISNGMQSIELHNLEGGHFGRIQ